MNKNLSEIMHANSHDDYQCKHSWKSPTRVIIINTIKKEM